MADICPTCRYDIDPFVAHFCGDSTWERRRLSTSTSSSRSRPCACSRGSSCGSCGRDVRTTAGIAQSTGLALVVPQTIHRDARGNVRETFRESWFNPTLPMVRQLVRSESKPQTLRGMHLHRKQWDVWTFTAGWALVRLLDADGREQFIPAYGEETIAIPPGVAHGFYTEDGCTLLYALTEEYDGRDEFGFWPFDGLTEASHPGWPTSHLGLAVSERDLRAPRLADFRW